MEKRIHIYHMKVVLFVVHANSHFVKHVHIFQNLMQVPRKKYTIKTALIYHQWGFSCSHQWNPRTTSIIEDSVDTMFLPKKLEILQNQPNTTTWSQLVGVSSLYLYAHT